MKLYYRYRKWNNAIKELENRRIDYEAGIAEQNEVINFVTQNTETFENTIQNFNIQEYVADLRAELENLHEEYEAGFTELSDIIDFQIRDLFTDEISQQMRTGLSSYSMRQDKGVQVESPKREISIDHFEVEQLGKGYEIIRTLLLADEYDDDLDLESDELPGYQPIQVNGKTDVAAMGNPAINGENGANRATISGFLHGQKDAPDDLLVDSGYIAKVIGDGDSKASRLIRVMMENDWQSRTASLKRRFPGEFINPIIDAINEIALENIGDNLISEDDGLWIIEEEYRDEIEYILRRSEYLHI